MKKYFLTLLLGLFFVVLTGNAGERFSQTVMSDGKTVILDRLTKLTWTNDFVTVKNWQQAVKYCNELNYGGITDWKLPNIDELGDLVNTKTYDPATDLPNTPASKFFWSSSSYEDTTNIVWVVNFYFGYVYYSYKDVIAHVRCIRMNAGRYNCNGLNYFC